MADFCILRENIYYRERINFVISSIVRSMCFYNNYKTLEKTTLTIVETNVYTNDFNNVILQTTNQSNFSIKKIVVKINDIVFLTLFSVGNTKEYLMHAKLTKLI